MGNPPTGLVAEIKGMSSLLIETLAISANGLIAAIVVILLLLAANYQSFGVSISVLSTVPAVILGRHAHAFGNRCHTQPSILYGYYYVRPAYRWPMRF